MEVMEKCSLVIYSQHVKYLRKCTTFRSDVEQNKGNNLTFGVTCILVALFTVAAGNEVRVDSVLIQPFLFIM